MISGEKSPRRQKIILPDLKSRICKDLEFHYQFDIENAAFLTNMGEGISLDAQWIKVYLDVADDQVGSIYTGTPATIRKTTFIKDTQIQGLESLNFSIETPWVKAKRICQLDSTSGHVKIDEQVTILQSYISAQDIRTPAYQDLKNKLKQYCHKVVLIVNAHAPEKKGFFSHILNRLGLQ